MRSLVSTALSSLALFLSVMDCRAEQTFTLTTFTQSPFSREDRSGIADLVLHEAFRRIGRYFTVSRLPAERALINANEGIDDGTFIRVEGMEKNYPNLLRVPESVATYEFMVFTKKVSFVPYGWASLEPYDVGIILGWKILEANVTGVRSLAKVEEPFQLFGLLARERVDLVVTERRVGCNEVRRRKIPGIKVLEPPLTTQEMFLYLHQKHEALAQPLAATLRDMKRDGTYEKLVEKALDRETARGGCSGLIELR